MQLQNLKVLHLSKKWQGIPVSPMKKTSSLFYLETCQRYLWILNGASWNESQLEVNPEIYSSPEIYSGKEAYLFLLRVATGLESEIIGETDIFGQLKEAWNKQLQTQENPDLVLELGPWMQKLFEDTKEIRNRFLQNLGGSSYGTLIRRMMKDLIPSEENLSPILFIGAGKIAQSVAPFLLESELWLSNRNLEHLSAFYQSLSSRPHQGIKVLSSLEEEKKGWQTASVIVVCIPLDPHLDHLRMEWFQQGEAQNRILIHLGGFKEECGDWNRLQGFFCLSHLFELQKSVGAARSIQVAQAHKACEERAQLRTLGSSLSIPHGWEDLACFC